MQSRTHLHDLLVSTLFTEGLDSDMDLWALGFTAIWVKGADLDALARTFGMDLVTRTPCHLSEILDHAIDDGSRWVGDNPDDLVEIDESISSALALIGRFTETDMATDWFQAQHSRVKPASLLGGRVPGR
ncbi:hypothetical protein ABZ897_62230 [Nonomuraea sp. NPDC046802]|uniref:hypothetical protein n=1 Tax=Nonomuraea sp. NPDC046802 TaxID=3154919 RepID=UPI0033EA0294